MALEVPRGRRDLMTSCRPSAPFPFADVGGACDGSVSAGGPTAAAGEGKRKLCRGAADDGSCYVPSKSTLASFPSYTLEDPILF